MAVPLFDTDSPLVPLRSAIMERIAQVVASGQFVLGPEVEAFEAELAAYLGVRHVIGVANGTDALVIALRALGVKPGDDVVLPALTFYATAEAVADVGARPVIREWVRFEPTPHFEDPFIDAARPLILLDTFGWPAVWQKYRGVDFVAPNLDTYVSFHRPAAQSEWLLVDHECPVADDGLLGVSGRIWDEAGRLLASGSAQLCCMAPQ